MKTYLFPNLPESHPMMVGSRYHDAHGHSPAPKNGLYASPISEARSKELIAACKLCNPAKN